MSSDVNVNINTTADTGGIDLTSNSLIQLQEQADGTTTAVLNTTSALSTSARIGDTAVLAVDRLQISQDIVTNASIRQELAQTRLSDAIAKSGANSEAARRAQDELRIATDNVTVAHTRQEERLVSTALIAIPRMITGLKELSTAFQAETVDEEGNIVATEGLTAAKLGLLAVTTLGVALPAAFAALALVQGANVGGGASTNNIYGDINNYGVPGAGTPGASTAQFALSARP